MTTEAEYVSKSGQEYKLIYKAPYWEIYQVMGGWKKNIQGKFLTKDEAAKYLVAFLKKNDKWKHAVYPGSHDAKSGNQQSLQDLCERAHY